MADDLYRKRFGDIALERAMITPEQLDEALEAQKERAQAGKPYKLLGQILLEFGYLETEQIQEVIDILYPAEEEAR